MKFTDFLLLTLDISGYVLLIYFANWQIALGVFLAIWGNNIDMKYSWIKS